MVDAGVIVVELGTGAIGGLGFLTSEGLLAWAGLLLLVTSIASVFVTVRTLRCIPGPVTVLRSWIGLGQETAAQMMFVGFTGLSLMGLAQAPWISSVMLGVAAPPLVAGFRRRRASPRHADS
ncbi:hypothetical protein HC251_17285 [Iamia sp. SCSIO 61187]|uniref:hypothetical protein n=1 Tax=Iamia sp. SCSIO 61187 TaxID=2722752 RepID=UPI001C62893C|nr:hypothetical protein [Iamia sp. SCSIO 61187]QYG94017.1 hypothetical protein HC251_17285 [Iamia sp. SCSIO 61187]